MGPPDLGHLIRDTLTDPAVIDTIAGSVALRLASPDGLPPLSVIGQGRRRLDALRLFARGLTNRDIAEVLVISTKTVEAHIDCAMQATGSYNTRALLRWCVRHRLDTQPIETEHLNHDRIRRAEEFTPNVSRSRLGRPA